MSDQIPNQKNQVSANRPHWTTLLTGALVTISAMWIVYLLYQSRREFIDGLQSMNTVWLSAGLLLGVLAAATSGETFYLVIRSLTGAHLTRSQAHRLQYVAALARNLPGRFWGIAYQVTKTRRYLPVSSLLVAQSLLALIAIYFTVCLSVVILIWEYSNLLSSVLLCFVLPGYLLCLASLRWLYIKLHTLNYQGRLARAIKIIFSAIGEQDKSTHIHVFLIAGLGWALYLGGWACIGIAHPSIDAHDGLRLAAFYSLAWLLGFITFITPSGLGVREMSFLFLANSFSAEVLALTVILGRLWFLVNDLILGIMAVALQKHNRSK